MTTRTSRKGMTLIEILLALIIMVLGVLGILALFPPAMESAKQSMEETNAALVGESVAQGMTNAMRLGLYDATKQQTVVTLTHDLEIGAIKMKYRFVLPRILGSADPQWIHFPGGMTPADPDQGQAITPAWVAEDDPRIFTLAGDGWVKETTQNVKNINDPTDSYSQFAFSFNIRKVYTLEYLIKPTPQPNPDKPGQTYTEKDVDPLMKLYEFQILVYRTAKTLGPISGGSSGGTTTGGGGAGGTSAGGGGSDVRRLVGVVSKRIAVQ
jgi:type II secretory pathway pseudopilin PulG